MAMAMVDGGDEKHTDVSSQEAFDNGLFKSLVAHTQAVVVVVIDR